MPHRKEVITMLADLYMLLSSVKQVYVDVDGTMLSNKHDQRFQEKIKEVGFQEAVAWYDNTEVDDLEVNTELLETLEQVRGEGVKVILWTNRGPKQIEMTKRNLGHWTSIFSDMLFREGRKSKDVLQGGVVLDNEEKYLLNAETGVKVIFA